MLFERQGLQALGDVEALASVPPSEAVLVILDDFDSIGSWGEIRSFLDRGGAVLIASDQRQTMSNIGFFRDGPVEVRHPEDAYAGYVDCPIVRDFQTEHPLMRGVQQLVANRSGWISRVSSNIREQQFLARYPQSTVSSLHSGRAMVVSGRSNRSVESRLLLIADHSLFCNSMLWHGDNALFAINTSEWLCSGKRKSYLMLANEPAPSAMPPISPEETPPIDLKDLPNLSPSTLLRFANNVSAGIEDENLMNDLLTQQPRGMKTPVFRRTLLLLLAVALGLYLLRQFMMPTADPLPEQTSRDMSHVTALQVERKAKQQQYHRSLKQLARDFLTELTGSDSPEQWQFKRSDVEVDGNWFYRSRIRNELFLLKKLAMGSRQWISRREFLKMARSIRTMKQMYFSGQIRSPLFQPPVAR